MPKYKRIKGGEKNALSGVPFSKEELEKVCSLYVDMDGKGIHERNPKIHRLSEELGRTIRSVENQLLGFRLVDSGTTGRVNYNKIIKEVWTERHKEVDEKETLRIQKKEERKELRTKHDDFRFRISSHLKDIIGKELITDDFIAVFELVKNSYDAHAKNVKIFFDDDKITIWDDGKGMDRDDILNKWLFVAYSAKKEGIEDVEFEKNKNYRDLIVPKQSFAGAKGIGRFSADRLGERLNLTTRKIVENSLYWTLNFNWDRFEQDAEDEFADIEVNHQSFTESPIPNFKHGVILEITNLRSVWPIDKILNLKWSLEKLINPFSDVEQKEGSNSFSIEIISKKDIERDKLLIADPNHNPRDIVNGPVKNFIFETLGIKTTQINVRIEDDSIITTLLDRGELIYKIQEENPFHYIPTGSGIRLFYLNFSAKLNFTNLMGIRSKDFGSIFLFNNGFRVFPIGEPEDDPFEVDRRKAQGHSRFLGTRELIGSVEIWGQSEHFVEASSRDGGLIESAGTIQLGRFFEDTLKKLERYVQPILWQIKKRTGSEDEEIDFNAQEDIVDLVAKLAGSKTVRLLDYSKSFIDILDEKIADASPELFDNLKKIAEESKDSNFINQIDKSELEFIKLKQLKEEETRKRVLAEERAEEEKEKRLEADRLRKEEENRRKEEEYNRLKAEEKAREERAKRIAEEQRRRQKESQVRFLESVGSLDIEDVLNLHHQVGIDANTIDTLVTNLQRKMDGGTTLTSENIREFLDKVTFANKKILAVTKFSTRQNFMAAARVTKDDIISFLKNYLLNIYKFHLGKELEMSIFDNVLTPFVIEFKPIEITIIVDNLISNSKKKNAKKVVFTFNLSKDGSLEISYKDDGDGLDRMIDNTASIFEKGFTTTRGSGLGLFHVRKIMAEQKGTITVNTNNKDKGLELLLNFKK
ncbi:ATP-binding protein [Pedobacter mucosus]|uniref:ATP-binding protein n=1 Tax=Pedobacter mucosus TaxID=2895286 RepID=UPI001EE3D6EC|nr:ATP-binding protein [Pedobacter mucosus]UKT65058.1 ATP-binding protein [Pedobacter mucosus]